MCLTHILEIVTLSQMCMLRVSINIVLGFLDFQILIHNTCTLGYNAINLFIDLFPVQRY